MAINGASAEQLAFQVDGTRSRYLIEEQNKLGRFTSRKQVKQVPCFEDKMVENLRKVGLTLGAQRSADKTSEAQARRETSSSRTGFTLNTASAEDLDRVFQIDGARAR